MCWRKRLDRGRLHHIEPAAAGQVADVRPIRPGRLGYVNVPVATPAVDHDVPDGGFGRAGGVGTLVVVVAGENRWEQHDGAAEAKHAEKVPAVTGTPQMLGTLNDERVFLVDRIARLHHDFDHRDISEVADVRNFDFEWLAHDLCV